MVHVIRRWHGVGRRVTCRCELETETAEGNIGNRRLAHKHFQDRVPIVQLQQGNTER